MRTSELVGRLEQCKFSKEQARLLASILEEQKETQVTKEYVALVVSQAKYDLVKWIGTGVITNELVATHLKYLG
jgi:uncharacterized membrane protein YukC